MSVASIFSLALIVRLVYWKRDIDGYGDSYHHWIISYITATNGYVQADYKPLMHIVWLPLYHYINAVLMNLFGIYEISIAHLVNFVFGAASSVMVYLIASRYYSRTLSFAAGVALAIQPWFIEFNATATPESVAVFFVLAGIYSLMTRRILILSIASGLMMLTRYEGWLFASIFFILVLWRQRSTRNVVTFASSTGIAAGIWMAWSYVNTGDPLGFLTTQFNMLGGARASRNLVFDPGRFVNIVGKSLQITWSLVPLGVAAAVIDRRLRLISGLQLFQILLLGTLAAIGLRVAEPRYLIYLLPLVAISIFGAVDRLPSGVATKGLILLAVIAFSVGPIASNPWVLRQPNHFILSEIEAGKFLSRTYSGGRIITDSPAVIYYSRVDPRLFFSSTDLFWYAKTWHRYQLREWLAKNDVRYLVWENTNYAYIRWIFPELSSGGHIEYYNVVKFVHVYSYTNYYAGEAVIVHIFKVLL